MTHTRPDGIGSVQWMHMEGAERSMARSGAMAPGDLVGAHALRSIAHSAMALVALLTDRLPPREPTPADLPPIPADRLAQYRMTDGGNQSNWRPVWDGMRVHSAGGVHYEFRTTRPGDDAL